MSDRDDTGRRVALLERENHRLKKEMRVLRRANTQLRRRLRKRTDADTQEPEDSEEEIQVRAAPVQPTCTACGGREFVSFETPNGRTVTACKSCKQRQ